MSQSMKRGLFVLLIAGAITCGTDDPNTAPSFAPIYNSDLFQMCQDCHSPNAEDVFEGTEATQNWSSLDAAFSSLQGNASGLIGIFADCNGVPFIGDTPETSLLVAIFDEDIRANFNIPGKDCDGVAITDKTLHVGPISPALLTDLKAWIDAGAPK